MSNFEYQKFLLEGKVPASFTATKLMNFIIKNYGGKKNAAFGMNSKYNEWDVKSAVVPSTDKLFDDLKAAGWTPMKHLNSSAHGWQSPNDPHGQVSASKKPNSKNGFVLTISASKKEFKSPGWSVYD